MQSTLSTTPPRMRSGALSYLSLFTSLSTLLCCALPSLFVLFGLGATVASVLSEAAWLVAMSHHKHWVFFIAGLLIAGNVLHLYAVAPKLQAIKAACDPNDLRHAKRRAASAALSSMRFRDQQSTATASWLENRKLAAKQ